VVHNFNPKQFKGQFILTAEQHEVPEWEVHEFNNWKLFTSNLPVINVFDTKKKWLGWCIGHPIVDGIFRPASIVLQDPVNTIDPHEDFYNRTTGKWILILIGAENKCIYLDPHGSLPAVFSTIEKTVAATPTLIGSDKDWDDELMNELNYPEKTHWLPSGVTYKKHVTRLQANHSLNLNTWEKGRHWPTPETEFSIDYDTASAVKRVTANIKKTISAVSKDFPLCLTLTGGMDSRMVLACARDHIQHTKVITFAGETENLDVYLAKRIAKHVALNHEFLNIENATKKELDQWQFITGKSIAGGVWKIHKTLFQLDPQRVFMSGQSGEVHRGNYWRPGDRADKKITATNLLKRIKFPPHPVLLKETDQWLKELEGFSTFIMLDLVHIEQRMSCWGAISHFGNLTSAFEISPLGSRVIFQNMMRLPHKYRKKQQLPYDICKSLWPELLKFPFNEYPGMYGYLRGKARKAKKNLKRRFEQFFG
jgi:hypothetical protein